MYVAIATCVFVIGVLSSSLAKADVYCGLSTCYGTGAYCCDYDEDLCCWRSAVTFWWFWFIWFWVFLLILACTIWICVRRRRRLAAAPNFVIVERQPAYGSMPVASPPQYAAPSATMPTAPAYQAKPPPYTPQ